MSLIKLLDSDTINQIAAGEVIDRPASIIKELVENSIDAGATAVSIEIQGGGIDLIRITDNGSGIDAEEVPVAFLRHATSKITDASQLPLVRSLGFRGEALASIAAVADVEVITRTKNEIVGTSYHIRGGVELGRSETGAPQGTTFLIRNVFENVPVRKKFLKTPSTEGAICSETIERIALSHPEISFKFKNNGRNMFFTNGNNKLKEMIYGIYGRDIANEMLETDGYSNGIHVYGLIARPVVARSNRNTENFFVNGRYIRSAIVSKGIENAYQPYLMQHKYPFTCLYIDIDPLLMDVNVHPSKQEVRFENPEAVYLALYNVISDVLHEKSHVQRFEKNSDNQGDNKRSPISSNDGKSDIENSKKSAQGKQSDNEFINIDSSSKGFRNENTDNHIDSGKNGFEEKEKTVERESKESAVNCENKEIADSYEDKERADSYEDKERAYSFEDKERADSCNAEENADNCWDKGRNNCCEELKQTDFFEENEIISERRLTGSKEDDSLSKKRISEYSPESEKNNVCNTINSVAEKEPVSYDSIPEPFEVKRMEQLSFDLKIEDSSEGHADSAEEFKNVFSKGYRIVGQVFNTYWIVEADGIMYMIDQHAAHEKIIYENMMSSLDVSSEGQLISPPKIITLSAQEAEAASRYSRELEGFGYCLEEFGGKEYALTSVPLNSYGLDAEALLFEILNELAELPTGSVLLSVKEKIATCSCKAAVKGNHELSETEARELIKKLLKAENPFNCPHGRPIIIDYSKYEIEKKFKRIL